MSPKLWYQEGYRRGIANGMLVGGSLVALAWSIFRAVYP